MLTPLAILSVLIWLPILIFKLSHRGLLVLLIWLFIAPVATNLVNGNTNPFFESSSFFQKREVRRQLAEEKQIYARAGDAYKFAPSSITLRELLNPTRNLMVIFMVIFMLNTVFFKKDRFLLNKTEIWMILFSLIAVSSAVFRANRPLYGIRTACDAFIVPFLGYFVTRRLLLKEEDIQKILRVLIYMCIYIIIICIAERLVNQDLHYRLTGPFKGGTLLYMPIIIGFFTIICLNLPLHTYQSNENPLLPRGIYWFIVLFSPVIIFLTWSRGNWVGFIIGVLIFLLLRHPLISSPSKFCTISLSLLFTTVLIFLIITALPEEIQQRSYDTYTVEWRLQRWIVAIEEAMKNLFFGLGLNNLRDVLGSENLNYTTAHNTFLSFLAELGIIGLIAYLAIIKSIFLMGWALYRRGRHPQDRWRGVSVIAVLLAYQIPAIFSNTIYSYDLGQIYVYVFVGAITGLYSRSPSVPDLYKFHKFGDMKLLHSDANS